MITLTISNFSDFKSFLLNLLKQIVESGDAKARQLQAKVEELSAELSAAYKTIGELEDQVKESENAKTKALAAQLAEQLAMLDALSTEIAESYNPTPVADAVINAVKDSDTMPTPEIISTVQTLDVHEPTMVEVSDAAVDAIVEVVPQENVQ